jgi:hypothetical protein
VCCAPSGALTGDGHFHLANGPGPALVDLVTDPNPLSMTPTITAAQVKGSGSPPARPCSTAASAGWSISRANACNIPEPQSTPLMRLRAILGRTGKTSANGRLRLQLAEP